MLIHRRNSNEKRSVIISNMRKKLKRWGKSLNFRLFLILFFVGIIPVNMLKYGILDNYEKQAAQLRAEQIRTQCQTIARQLGDSDYLKGGTSEVIDSEVSQLGNLYSGRVVIVNSNFKIVKDTYGIDEGKYLIAPEVIRSYRGDTAGSYWEGEEYMEVTVPVRSSGSGDMTGTMIISVPTDDILEGRSQLGSTTITLQAILVFAVLAAAFMSARMLTRPFAKVTASLEEDENFLDEDIEIPDFTETENLSEAYNRMRRRLSAQEAARNEFVSNVSHELKTPLTSMKVLSDSLTMQDDVPNELYKEFMVDIGQEIDRENKIINDLLSLVKMDRSNPDINIKETNINNLVELIIKRIRPIAAERGIELVQEDSRQVLAQVDETKLTLAISNLVENAVKYNKENGWVHVSLNMDNSFFFIKVEDSGLGIPEESQPYIFERFYRVDKSHSREIGGTGLGLAITKSAVQMHNGAIRCYSKMGEGTTFTIRIPLVYVSGKEDQEV